MYCCYLFYQVFILHHVPFICECTYEYVCNVSSLATEAEYINNNNIDIFIRFLVYLCYYVFTTIVFPWVMFTSKLFNSNIYYKYK